MATSLTRRNRRRRKAGTLVAVGAATALLAGGLAPAAPAQAFSLADIPGGCVAGGPNVSLPFGAGTATCEDASPAILAQIGDGLLGIFLPDLPISLGGLNGALGLGFPGIAPGHATIEGTGFNTAIAVGGNATAKSDYYLAGAVALALGGEAHAESLFGLSVAASTIGKPTQTPCRWELPWQTRRASSIGRPRRPRSVALARRSRRSTSVNRPYAPRCMRKRVSARRMAATLTRAPACFSSSSRTKMVPARSGTRSRTHSTSNSSPRWETDWQARCRE